MKLTKTLAAVAGVGLVAAGLLTAAPASADPTGTPAGGDRALAGVGSDTTQNVMNALSEVVTIGGVKQIASWDAIGAPDTFQTRTSNAACTYTRAQGNGSSNGRSRLLESLTAGNPKSGCLDFARSSSARGTFTSSPSMTWVPFAKDTSTYVVRLDGGVPRDLTLTQVQDVFKCVFAPDIMPVLPQTGSGSRAFWLSQMGITEAQITAGTYPCLTGAGTAASRAYVQENNAVALKADEMMPFSVGLWNTQAVGVNFDARGLSTLGRINSTLPIQGVSAFPVARDLYNIIPTANIGTSPWSTVFVGSSSLICQNSATIASQGFAPIANCGDTSSQS